MDVVAWPAKAMPTNGSPPAAPGYQTALNPSASARFACSTTLSTVAAPPVIPIRIRRTLLTQSGGRLVVGTGGEVDTLQQLLARRLEALGELDRALLAEEHPRQHGQ